MDNSSEKVQTTRGEFGINFELERLSNDQDKYRLRNNGVPVSYATFLENLAQSDEFRQIFIETLNGSRFETFRIETPPGMVIPETLVLKLNKKKLEISKFEPKKVSDALKDNAFEFILIDSPHLKGIKPDYYSFAEHFERAKGSSAHDF